MQSFVHFISAFDYICLMGCSPPEMPRCLHVGGLGKLVIFCRTELQILVSIVLSLVKIIIKPLQVAPFKYIFVFDFH